MATIERFSLQTLESSAFLNIIPEPDGFVWKIGSLVYV